MTAHQTATEHAESVPFTTEEHAARMARVADDGRRAGLDGVLVLRGRATGEALFLQRFGR